MAKLTDARVVTLKGHFETGDQPTQAQFADLIQWIQEGIEEHDHAGTGDGDGIMDIGPVSDLAIRMSNARSELNIECYDDGANHSRLYLKKSDTDVLGTLAQTDDGDQLMQIAGMGVGTNLAWAYGTLITAYQRGAAGANFVETDLILAACTTTGPNANQLYLDGGTGFVGMGTATPVARAHIANEVLANTSGQHTLYLTENNSIEGAGQAFDVTKPFFGLAFRSLWGGIKPTNRAGIYAYGVPGYKGGLVFRTKNIAGDGGPIDTTVMVMQPDGKVGIGIPGPLGKLHIDQSVNDAAIPVLILDQADVSEGTINFIASARGVIGEGTNSVQSVRVELGGVVYRLALYADA